MRSLNRNLRGFRVGKITVLEPAEKDAFGHKRWSYLCDCGQSGVGNEDWVVNQVSVRPKSCGCEYRIKEVGGKRPCCRCKKLLDRTYEFFVPEKKNKDGLGYQCRMCQASSNARWAKNNLEKRREIQRLYRLRNIDKERIRQKKYSKQRDWNRRAKLHGCVREKIDFMLVVRRDKGMCHICGRRVLKSQRSLDHIKPLFRGGDHTYANVALAHIKCNQKKGTKIL